jgi:hypothetical protein
MLLLISAVWVVLFIGSSLAFDDFIEYQNIHRHEYWLKDGKPRGMFYKPKGGSFISMYILSFKLPKNYPDWAKNDQAAEALYSKYKLWGKLTKWYAIAFLPLVIVAASI